MSDARRDILRMLTVTRVVSFFLRALPGGIAVEVAVVVVVVVAASDGSTNVPGNRSVLDTTLSLYTVC